ncbi:hypothetical protein ACUTFT_23420, partial [Citrobacter freundii]
RCHRQNMKTSIINGSEVSRLSVAIQEAHVTQLTTAGQNNNMRGKEWKKTGHLMTSFAEEFCRRT